MEDAEDMFKKPEECYLCKDHPVCLCLGRDTPRNLFDMSPEPLPDDENALPSPPKLIRQNAQKLSPEIEALQNNPNTILHFVKTLNKEPQEKKKDLPQQILLEKVVSRLSTPAIPSEFLLKTFGMLARELEQSNPQGDGEIYHSLLNRWFSARLSKPNTAYMIIKYFKLGKQVCHMFDVIDSDKLFNRMIRGMLRYAAKKERTQ